MGEIAMDPCGDANSNMQKEMSAFQQKLEAKIATESAEIEKDAKAIKDDGDKWGEEKKKDAVWFKFDTWMADTDILLPNIEVTMRDKKIAFDVPEFKTDTTSIHVTIPEIKMVMHVVGRIPHSRTEWVVKNLGFGLKTKVPVTTVWWEDIKTLLPETTFVDKEIKLDLPQAKMVRREMILKLPEVTFSQKKIVIRLPQFRFHSMGINSSDDEGGKDLERRGKDLEARSMKAVSDAMGEAVNESEQSVTLAIHQFFQCQLSELTRLETDSTTTFDALVTGFNASLQALNAQTAGGTGQEQVISQINGSIAEIAKQRADAQKSFQEQRVALLDEENNAVHAFLDGLKEKSGLHPAP